MADFGPHAGDSFPATGQVTMTPGSSAHSKGSWATFSNGPRARVDGFFLMPAYLGSHSTCRTLFLDIGVGSGPTTIISNLMVCPPHANSTTLERDVAKNVFFPVSLPPSEDIKARSQSSMASHATIYVDTYTAHSGLPCVGSVVDTYGADTTNTKGVTLTAPNTDGGLGAWSVVVASSERIKALIVAVGHGQADWSTYGNQWGTVHIGIGAGGSEQVVVSIDSIGTGNGIRVPSQSWFGPYYVDIPAGTNISARVAKQYASSSQRTFDVILYGIR